MTSPMVSSAVPPRTLAAGREHPRAMQPMSPKTGSAAGPSALVDGEGERRGVGDGVVEEHGEGAEPDRAPNIGDEHHGDDRSGDGELGPMRDATGGVHGVEPAG